MNRAQLQSWYEQYGYAVHSRCARLLGSKAEADDALQDIFLKAARSAQALRDEDPMHWLYRIADNHCFDVIRSRKKFVSNEENENAMLEREQSVHPSAEPNRFHLVAQVLAACKERVRDVAKLYYFDELTQDEVAEATGYSRKTVKEKLTEFRTVASQMLGASLELGDLP